MRLAAQAKLGFYPAPNDAIRELCKHLVLGPKDKQSWHHILDPCCGEGQAINTMAEELNIPRANVFCVELDEERGKLTRALMPGAPVLSPCSFFTMYAPCNAFGLIYCNPPFDDELGGGGREETAFAREIGRLLVREGILVFVAPWTTFQNRNFSLFLDANYKDARLYRFPKQEYRECVYIGVKRSTICAESQRYLGHLYKNVRVSSYNSEMPLALAPLGEPDFIWQDGHNMGRDPEFQRWVIPSGWRTHKFIKTGYVQGELEAAVARSPLNRVVEESLEPQILRPPLPLAEGHIGLQLASGALNGLLELPGGLTHVVRGVPSKEEYENTEEGEERISEDGKSVSIKTVFSQRITLMVRTVGLDGEIYTFSSSTKKEGNEQRVTEETMSVDEYNQRKRRGA